MLDIVGLEVKKMNARLRSYVNAVALIIVLFVNFIASNFTINNLTTSEVSDELPVLFTPAGYVFSIWGLIYLLLIGFVIYQALPDQENNALVSSIGYLFALSSLLNIIWIFTWHYLLIPWSMIVMVLLLVTLVGIYLKINNQEVHQHRKLDFLLIKVPFNIYLGWICVATIANFNVFLYDAGLLATATIGSIIWTMFMILIGALIALVIAWKRRDYIISLVFVWAFIGIGVRHGTEFFFVTLTAWIGAIAIFFFLGWITATGRIERN